MKNIAVYCGSSKGFSSVYSDAALALGEVFVDKGISLVYGAGSVGLMGVIADRVLEGGGHVVGVIPQFLMDKEVGHNGLSELIVVEDMHKRKMKMVEMSDGFIAMPGGFGTLDEIFEVLTWQQLNLHAKPIAFYNVNGYFTELIGYMKHMIAEGFLRSEYVDLIIVSDDPNEIVSQMMNHEVKSIKFGKWV